MPRVVEKSNSPASVVSNFVLRDIRFCCSGFVLLPYLKAVSLKKNFGRKGWSAEFPWKISGSLLRRRACVQNNVRCSLKNLFNRSFESNRSAQWEHLNDLYILRPSSFPSRPPLGVIHFVGGAFVSSISQLAYRALLEGLAQKGYFIVVTPYDTTFDHLVAAESVNRNFTSFMRELREECGRDLPVVGLSHSLGCIIQILSTCLFPHEDFITKGHIFMAYNNKTLDKAIPLYRELLVPSANLVSKESLNKNWMKVSSFLEAFTASTRESFMKNIDPGVFEEYIYPSWLQVQRAWKQLDTLLEQVQSGRDEFYPSPNDIENVIIEKYSRPSVLIRCEDDSIDESLQLYRLLRRRNLYIKLRSVPGTHLTPLEQSADSVDNFLKTNFRMSSPFIKNRNLSRLIETVGDSAIEIILEQASTRT